MDHNIAITNQYTRGIADAVRIIATDRPAAVESYGHMSAIKAKPEEIAALLADPETSFTVEPKGIMQYVDFLEPYRTDQGPARYLDRDVRAANAGPVGQLTP